MTRVWTCCHVQDGLKYGASNKRNDAPLTALEGMLSFLDKSRPPSAPLPPVGRHDAIRRWVGPKDSDVLYFLPWGMPLTAAYWGGLLPLPFVACYETPTHIVSADPAESVVTLSAIVNDAAAVISERRNPEPPLLIGFSLGTIAATYLANRFHAPLLSICGAARGEDMIWSCPAAARVRLEAERRGYRRTHFNAAFDSFNPARNLNNLDQRSLFVVATHDFFVPSSLRTDWVDIVRSQTPALRMDVQAAGHIEAIWGSRPLQRQWVQTGIGDRVNV